MIDKRELLTLRNLTVRRGHFQLTIDYLAVRQGEILCVVGPNGGGKTTLLLTALGLLPHQGRCVVDGEMYDGTQAYCKAAIGFIPDDPELLFGELTAREQWELTASVVGKVRNEPSRNLAGRAETLATRLAFTPPAKLTKFYSHGQRKKTQIVNALLGQPPVLVIDELRNGLDPIASQQAEELITAEKARGAAILVATHDLDWAQRFADRICVLHQGRVVAMGSVRHILKSKERTLQQAFVRLVAAEL